MKWIGITLLPFVGITIEFENRICTIPENEEPVEIPAV